MEKEIGEEFQYGDTLLKVVKKSESCRRCYFDDRSECRSIESTLGYCNKSYRDDKKDVIFTEVKPII